jgi:hypothetical protein
MNRLRRSHAQRLKAKNTELEKKTKKKTTFGNPKTEILQSL